jgi:non-ribosomal peptide synthetase component E (peptide arylation enzyme)
VAAGLRANLGSGSSVSGGALRGGLDETSPKLAAGYSTYAELMNNLELQQNSVEEGMTVRWVPQTEDDYNFQNFATTANGALSPDPADESYWGPNGSPRILITGGVTGTTLLIEAIVYLEVSPRSIQDYVWGLRRSPSSSQWATIVALTRDNSLFPTIAQGHSFKSFFDAMGRMTKKAIGWLLENGPKWAPLLQGAMALI